MFAFSARVESSVRVVMRAVACPAVQDVNRRMFGSTEAFLAEAKWILHNCIVFNGGKIFTDP